MEQDELRDFMEHLAPPKVAAKTDGNIPPQLYSLRLGNIISNLSPSATAAIVDALSQSGLPFFEIQGLHRMDLGIEVQLQRNQCNYMLESDSKRVPAMSIRLFICGDPFAGKT